LNRLIRLALESRLEFLHRHFEIHARFLKTKRFYEKFSTAVKGFRDALPDFRRGFRR
jgi:hypothetical protein